MICDWEERRLDELVELRKEKLSPSLSGRLIYIGLEHMAQGQPKLIGAGNSDDVISEKSRFESGDLLYGKLRPELRKAIMAKSEGICSTDILVLRPKRSHDSEFLLHLLHSNQFYRYAIKAAEGTKMPRVDWQHLAAFPFLCPPPAGRDRIAVMLDSIDAAIERTEAVIAATQGLRHGLTRELLIHGLPGSHTEYRHVPGIGDIPTDWKVVPLREIIERPTYGTNQRLITKPASFAVLRMGAINSGRISFEDIRWADLPADEAMELTLKPGDILFNRTNSIDLVGKTAILHQVPFPTSFASYLLRIRTKVEQANPFWLSLMMNLPLAQDRLRHLATKGASQANINPTSLGSLEIPCPPLDEQNEIVKVIEGIDQRLNHEQLALNSLHNVKRTVADALLSGRIRVSDPMKVDHEYSTTHQ